jgi:hypothetical protein
MKYLISILLLLISFISHSATSPKGIKQIPYDYDWVEIDITEGGFEQTTNWMLVKKSIDDLAAISLHEHDFTIVIYDKKPDCDVASALKVDKNNKCRLRIKIDGNIHNLSSHNNYWINNPGIGFLQKKIDNKSSKNSALLIYNAKDVSLEIYDGKNYYVYKFKSKN